MRILERLGKVFVVFGAFALAAYFALQFGSGGLWRGFEPALAVTSSVQKPPYDLTRLEAVNETLKMIRDKYVDPDRVKPKDMLMSALNYVQRDVAQVIVSNDDPNEVTVRVETAERKFRVDNVQGPWDVSARLARSSPSSRRTSAAPRSICARSSTRPATACSTPSIRTRSS